MPLDEKSRKKLEKVHSHLEAVITLAADRSPLPFIVTEGLRTAERQKQLFAAGATRTLNSRHLFGKAVDIAAVVDGEVRWDWPLYDILARAIKDAAADLKVPIVWGGDWTSFRDGPHFELDRKVYQ